MDRLVCLLFVLTSSIVWGQSTNDNMAQAIPLSVNQSISSFTHGNTIEYFCIEPGLTSKCIKYHNDQWFTFVPEEAKPLYINITKQSCRDIYGVQLVVLTGELCTPKSYELIDCVSMGTQDDVYVEILNPKIGQKYWLLVDGYLHDFCKFDLGVSHQAEGMSAHTYANMGEVGIHGTGRIVELNWTIEDSVQAANSVIYRKRTNDFTYEIHRIVPVVRNAYGSAVSSYSIADTVNHPGDYMYRLVVEDFTGTQYQVSEVTKRVSSGAFHYINLPLDYDHHTKLLIRYYANNKILKVHTLEYSNKYEGLVPIVIDEFLDRSIHELEIEVIDIKEQHIKSYFCDLQLGKVYAY